MGEDVSLEITAEKDAVVVSFKATSISNYERISAASSQIHQFVEKNHPRFVIFDFEQVKFFSSQVLGLLLEVRSELQEQGGDVVISAIDPQLHRVFKITNLEKIFKFFPDKQSALNEVIAD